MPELTDPSESRRTVCAVVILAGVTGRLATVRDALGRNFFDLPFTANRTLLGRWRDRFRQTFGDTASVPVHIAIDEGSFEPMLADADTSVRIHANRDHESSRGTAGILRDLTRELPEDADVLVFQASDLTWDWTTGEAGELLNSSADIVLSTDRDLRPSGFMRIRCGLLRRVPSVGFVDLKEQFLARCAASSDFHLVRSARRQRGSLHSLQAYLAMIGLGPVQDSDGCSLAVASAWQADRSVIEPTAQVDPSAILFDSVVLAGAHVNAQAVIVRSLIGAGARVPARAKVVDQVLVGSTSRRQTNEVRW